MLFDCGRGVAFLDVPWVNQLSSTHSSFKMLLLLLLILARYFDGSFVKFRLENVILFSFT